MMKPSVTHKPNDGIYLQTLARLQKCQRAKGRAVTVDELVFCHPGYSRAGLVYHLRHLAAIGCVEAVSLNMKWHPIGWKLTDKGLKSITEGVLPKD